MSVAGDRELIQLRADLASALGIRVDSNAAMVEQVRALRAERDAMGDRLADWREDHGDAQVVLQQWVREAFRLAEHDGWSSFGTHADGRGAELEFDGQDAAGMPLWERPKSERPVTVVERATEPFGVQLMREGMERSQAEAAPPTLADTRTGTDEAARRLTAPGLHDLDDVAAEFGVDLTDTGEASGGQ